MAKDDWFNALIGGLSGAMSGLQSREDDTPIDFGAIMQQYLQEELIKKQQKRADEQHAADLKTAAANLAGKEIANMQAAAEQTRYAAGSRALAGGVGEGETTLPFTQQYGQGQPGPEGMPTVQPDKLSVPEKSQEEAMAEQLLRQRNAETAAAAFSRGLEKRADTRAEEAVVYQKEKDLIAQDQAETRLSQADEQLNLSGQQVAISQQRLELAKEQTEIVNQQHENNRLYQSAAAMIPEYVEQGSAEWNSLFVQNLMTLAPKSPQAALAGAGGPPTQPPMQLNVALQQYGMTVEQYQQKPGETSRALADQLRADNIPPEQWPEQLQMWMDKELELRLRQQGQPEPLTE